MRSLKKLEIEIKEQEEKVEKQKIEKQRVVVRQQVLGTCVTCGRRHLKNQCPLKKLKLKKKAGKGKTSSYIHPIEDEKVREKVDKCFENIIKLMEDKAF